LRILERIADAIEALIDWIGRVSSWLVLAVVFFLFVQNPLREYIGRGQFAANDMGQLCHAAVFMIGVAYAWRWDRQVRVDLFYRSFSPRVRAIVNLLGTLLLLSPWLALVGWNAWPEVVHSWKLWEHFPETETPGYFLLKTLLVVFALTMTLQAIAVIARSVATIFAAKPKALP
jgi:TRAP-type mannitol/chloroaromatic compound transport system permease small subunit